MGSVVIRAMNEGDLDGVAAVHQAAFVRQKMSRNWIGCNFAAFPRMQFFVAEQDGTVCGFIHWTQKSGFRAEVVLELEQIGVHPDVHGQGIGTSLIRDSLPMVCEQFAERRAVLKHIIVTTRADNDAQRLYKKVLGAEIEAVITNLYSADEVLMIVRHVSVEGISGQ